jgi:nucleoside-diphosphate-sugar epimerase
MAIDSDQTIRLPGVLLTGASSQIGVFLIPRLLKAGFRIIAVSRSGKPDAYPELEQVTWLNESDAINASRDFRYLISAGPMKLAQRFLRAINNPVTAIVFSSSSVETKLESHNALEKGQMQAMLAEEAELQKTAETNDSKLIIFRPTLIYGCGLDSNISRLATWIKRFGFMPVNGNANGLRQPVHADDLAIAAVTALQEKGQLPAVLTLSGGETLSYSEMLVRIFASMKKPPRLLRLPQWLFILMLRVASVFGLGRGVNDEMVKRQKLDLVFDDQLARDLLAYKPRSFSPTPADFSLPDLSSKEI